MVPEKHIAPPQSERIRLSDYAKGKFHTITTRKGIKKAIDKGWVTINGRIAKTSDYITGGEELILSVINKKRAVIHLKLKVLFEDDHLAIINKPAGITVSGNKKHTLQNALSNNLKESKFKDALPHPQLTHRLDHPTQGLMIVGKTRSSVVAINALFEKKEIAKTYHAITIGIMPKKGSIKTAIDDKPSTTYYEIIDQQNSERFEQLNLVKLNPTTGRRHQIRKHLHSIGHPILGDRVYYTDEATILKGHGLYLQASRLSFIHPVTFQELDVSTALPKKFRKIFPQI